HFNKEQAGSAEYRFDVVEEDVFTFWLRANASAGARLSWSLDGGPSRLVEWKDGRGAMNIATDNKPDMRYISWFKVGRLNLKAGRHSIAFRMDSKSHNHGAIDCFTFTRIPFVPSGANRPSVRTTSAGPDEWFPFIADDDPFSKDSVIDVSRLVDAPAGKHGFLKREGDRLSFEKAAQPIKFWAMGSSPGGMSPRQMKQAAKWYRKHGVNLVRQHTVLGVTGLMDARGEFDKAKLDRYDRWFAAMREEGVYSTWSIIYPHHQALLQKHDDYDPAFFAEMDRMDGRHDGNRQALVLNDFVNIDRRLQDVALKYFRKLLEHRNPYTGLAYKDDPALAILEFQNESNLFFHTLNGMFLGKAPLFAKMMRKRFFAFVKNKYKSKDAVARAWDNKWSPRDRWDEGELGLQGAYHWGADGPLHEYRGQFRRTGDYIEFLTRVQREYYSRRQKEVRDLGFRGVTVTTAWHAGGPAASMANLFCDTAADMIDRHNYSGGGAGGHVITEGKVSNQTHLDKPGRGLFNLALFQVEDRPFGISEWIMSPPAPYKAEAAPLFAFYGMGLQGWDASYHFSCGQSRYGDGWPNLSKYASHTPHYMGQFPALAFAIHNNHVREGAVVKARQLTDKELFAGKDVLGQARSAGSHDLKKLASNPTTPTELFAIGRLTIGFSGKPPPARLDLSRYWDQGGKILRSTTGDLVWDYGNRIVEVRSAKTQAVIGFAGGRAFDLPGARVTVKTPFVSLILTPLDNL
ncbi:MAG: hypothetical protein VX317_07335, partial [Verrucomicrobiota bacterium]|nr:hypothetical protein [Verrucomicrobiota bacterium]